MIHHLVMRDNVRWRRQNYESSVCFFFFFFFNFFFLKHGKKSSKEEHLLQHKLRKRDGSLDGWAQPELIDLRPKQDSLGSLLFSTGCLAQVIIDHLGNPEARSINFYRSVRFLNNGLPCHSRCSL